MNINHLALCLTFNKWFLLFQSYKVLSCQNFWSQTKTEKSTIFSQTHPEPNTFAVCQPRSRVLEKRTFHREEGEFGKCFSQLDFQFSKDLDKGREGKNGNLYLPIALLPILSELCCPYFQSYAAQQGGCQLCVVTEDMKCIWSKLRCDISIKYTLTLKDLWEKNSI